MRETTDEMIKVDSLSEHIWGLEDYRIIVPMTDNFYRGLNFNRISLEEALAGVYQPQARYRDSRTYLRPIMSSMAQSYSNCLILDVGGYIGRFSIEATLAARELDSAFSIFCLEPGQTRDILKRNIKLNGMDNEIEVLPYAASNRDGKTDFLVRLDAKISSRIVVAHVNDEQQPINQQLITVDCRKLETVIDEVEKENVASFICKIDTEGHEPSVIEGLGNYLSLPHVLIVEYWPWIRDFNLCGRSFESYILENYHCFDIGNALYPRRFLRLDDLDGVTEMLKSKKAGNLDLLLIHKTVINSHQISNRISMLS